MMKKLQASTKRVSDLKGTAEASKVELAQMNMHLLEAAREDEEEQLVYQNAQDDGMDLTEGQEPTGKE